MRLNSLAALAHRYTERWTTGDNRRVYRYDPNLDHIRLSLTKKLTFQRLENILSGSDAGDLADALALFEDMEERDSRLRSVAQTRRRAVTGLPWEVISAAEVDDIQDRELAEAVAAYCRKELANVRYYVKGVNRGFGGALNHLATAIGPNLAVLEQVWALGRLAELIEIPSSRLTMNLRESQHVRVITQDERAYGIAAVQPKFVVHIPESGSLSPLSKSLTRAQAWLWLIKKLALSDWATFVHLFGVPVRIGKYPSGTDKEVIEELEDMLQNMGSSAWAVVSNAVQIEFAESASRGLSPHQALMQYIDREYSIGWLGANLTSDTTGGTGTFAAASVQDEVRDDIRDEDINAEGRTVREQMLRPMVRLKFGPEAPVPYFSRRTPEVIDRLKEAQLMEAAQRLGIRIPEKHAYDVLGIKVPDGKEDILTPSLEALAADVSDGANAFA